MSRKKPPTILFLCLSLLLLRDYSHAKKQILSSQDQLSEPYDPITDPPIPDLTQTKISDPSFARLLQNTVLSNSRTCKRDCIDANKNFCPAAAHTGSGTCCASATCPRASGDVCSFDIKNDANKIMKYWACGDLCSA